MSTAIFSYQTYTQSKEFTTYDDSEDEDYNENYNNNNNYNNYYNDFSMQEITQLNKLDKSKTTSGKTGTVIPLTNKNYQAAVEYKKAKRAAIKALHSNNSDSTTQKVTPTPSESEDTSSGEEQSNKTKKLTKSQVNSIITNEIDYKKKERLPSSIEVYNRILHDELLADKINDFIISYEDRFDGLLDVEFLKYEIGSIPLHRVKQIRHLNTIVWDRSERIYDFSKLFE